DILGVLAEDHDLHLAGVLHGCGHTGEMANRPHAGIKIELLADRDVERTDAAPHRGAERPFDGDDKIAQYLQRFLWKPCARAVDSVGLLARVDLHPHNAT